MAAKSENSKSLAFAASVTTVVIGVVFGAVLLALGRPEALAFGVIAAVGAVMVPITSRNRR